MTLKTARAFGAVLLASLLVLAAGCGKANPAAPAANAAAQQNADDAAQQVALTMAQGNGGSPAAPAVSSHPSAGVGQPAASETTFTAGHVTWGLTLSWYDAADAPMPAFDPVNTVRMVALARGVGTIETVSDTASFGSAGTLDVRGLSLAQDTLSTNAHRADTLQVVFTPVLRGGRVHVYSEATGDWSDVRQLKPVESHPWPVSGSATWVLHVSRLRSSDRGDVASTFDATVVVTFNGTRYPTVTVSGGYHYILDLATGAIVRA